MSFLDSWRAVPGRARYEATTKPTKPQAPRVLAGEGTSGLCRDPVRPRVCLLVWSFDPAPNRIPAHGFLDSPQGFGQRVEGQIELLCKHHGKLSLGVWFPQKATDAGRTIPQEGRGGLPGSGLRKWAMGHAREFGGGGAPAHMWPVPQPVPPRIDFLRQGPRARAILLCVTCTGRDLRWP